MREVKDLEVNKQQILEKIKFLVFLSDNISILLYLNVTVGLAHFNLVHHVPITRSRYGRSAG